MMTEVNRTVMAMFGSLKDEISHAVTNDKERQKVITLLDKAEEVALKSIEKTHMDLIGG